MRKVHRTFRYGRVVWQQGDDEMELPNAAVSGGVDRGGKIVLQQEGREIVLDRASAPMIRELERAVNEGEP